MSVPLILNLLLGGLLVAALALGLRLDRRLKALRDSQAGFIKAVEELDQAAAKTRAGLNQWREATDEARELLHDRIEKAKVQSAKLEKLLAQPIPEPAAPRIEPARAEPSRVEAVRAEAARRVEPSRDPVRPAAREAAQASDADPVLNLTNRDILRRTPPLREAAIRDFPKPSRSRAKVDDDLFELPEPPLGAAGLQRDLAAALGRRS